MDDLLSEKEQIEQMRAWWSDYGNYVIAGVVLGALVLTGFNYYRTSQREAELAASALYDTLTGHVADGRLEEAQTVAGDLIGQYPDSPYATQSQLAMARLYMDQNRDKDAVDTLRDLLAGNADAAFKHVASVRLGKLLLYQEKAEEVIELLQGEESGAFAARYAEVLGDAHVMLGQFDAAREAYERALAESNQGATVDRTFVQLKLLDLPIDGNGAQAGTDGASDEAADEEAE